LKANLKPLNKIKHTALIIFLLQFGFTLSFAQPNATVVLSGSVSTNESHEKLIGVNVYLKGTTTGTVTNENGFYSLKLPEGNTTIVYSFIGYQTQEKSINLKGDKTVNVTLEQNEEMLQEISITSQRKFFGNMDYGRDIPTVKSEEIEKLNSTNASDILHARLSGVWATKTSGAPGDQQKIRIRGQASFFSSSEPLYVIDGVPVPIVNLASLGIGDLNMHDIESVTVLKDASSTALYGYQGGNGVVLIDTKQHSENKLDFSYRTGIQCLGKHYDLMNTEDFLNSLDLGKQNIKATSRNYFPEYTSELCSHDRQEEIFQKGYLQEYQLSGGGKLSNINYYLSGNYAKHQGIVKESSQEKYTFSARVGTTIGHKLALNISYRWNYQDNINNQNEYMGNQLIFQGISQVPCIECTPDSLYYDKARKNKLSRLLMRYELLNSEKTPETLLADNLHSFNYYNNSGSLMARYQFNNHLSADIIESFMVRKSIFETNSDFFQVNMQSFYSKNHVDLKSNENIALVNHQINISYNRQIGVHGISLLAAHRFYSDNLWWNVDSLGSVIPEHFYLRNSMAGHGKTGSVIRRISSYIGHASYNYDNRYFVSAVANVSQLKEGLHVNYYTLFPSVSLCWNIAHESFFSNSPVLNELEIYCNFGTSGNYPLNGLSNDLIQHVPDDYFNFVANAYIQLLDTISYTDENDKVIKQLANHNLKHETNTELDLGFKSSFFKDRLKIDVAWYSKKIGNQIILRDIPYYYGGGKMYLNLGDIAVNGYELGIEAIPFHTSTTSWVIQGNLSSSRQKVTRLADGQEMLFNSSDLLFPDFRIKEGGKLGDIYGYGYVGKWTDEDNLKNDLRYAESTHVKFLNPDTINHYIDGNDKLVIGNSIPKFNWNLMSSFQYKEFGVEVVIYSSLGFQKYNTTRAATYITGVNRELVAMYADTLVSPRIGYFYPSSYFVEDAGFVRLKTLSFSYEPQKKLAGINWKITLGFENLVTLTKYKGYDPEATIFTDNNFSDNAVDRGAYPNPQSLFFIINLKF